MKKYYKLSFRNERTSFYEAEDGDLIGYRGGTMNKLNTFSVDKDLNLVRSLYLDRSIAYVCGDPSKICVVKED